MMTMIINNNNNNNSYNRADVGGIFHTDINLFFYMFAFTFVMALHRSGLVLLIEMSYVLIKVPHSA